MYIKIYTKDYSPLASLVQTQKVSDFNNLNYKSSLNQVGRCNFTMRLDNAKTNELNTRHFNIVEVLDDDDTPRWCGVIVSLEIYFNTVRVTAFSMEHLLTTRLTGEEQVVSGEAGNVVSSLLSSANATDDMKITAGILDAETEVEQTFRRSTLLNALQRISDSSGGQFVVNADRSLDFRDVVGEDKTSTIIFQYKLSRVTAANILSFKVIDDGQSIVSKTYGKSGELDSIETDSTIESTYGLREEFKNFREIDNQDTLDEATLLNNTDKQLSPTIVLSPTVKDNFEVGDKVKVLLENRLVDIDEDYQVIEKTVELKSGGEKEITVKVNTEPKDIYAQIRDLKSEVSLLNREL